MGLARTLTLPLPLSSYAFNAPLLAALLRVVAAAARRSSAAAAAEVAPG